jgi:sporulation protein YlmC with PRC-barrel domain
MKSIAKSFIAAVAIAAAGPAWAQQKAPATPSATPPAAATPAKAAIPAGVFFKGQQANQYLIKDRLIGAKVVNKDGVIIGDIEDVILATNGNSIEGVILGVGGFLGAGEKKIGVRYASLNFSKKDNKTVIALPQATKEVLAALEPYLRAEARKSLLEKAREKAQELKDKAKTGGALDKAKEAGKNVVDKTKELGGAAVEKGKQVIDAAKDKAGTPKPQ